MNSKSQIAVFIIAISIIGMFIFYIVLVDPATRWEILFGDSQTNGGDNGGTTPGGSSEFYSVNLNQYIGGTNGEQIGTTHVLNNIYSAHPLVLSTIDVPSDLVLRTSWGSFIAGAYSFDIPSFINQNNSESIELDFTLSSTVGNPITQVKFNGNVLLERQMQLGENAHFSIPTTQFGETNNLEIFCIYTGFPLALWDSQTCSFEDITLERNYYLSTNSEISSVINLDEDEVGAGVMFVTFWVEESNPAGMFEIYLGDYKVYEGYPSIGNESFEVSGPNLTESSTLTFKATEGGTYRITKAEVVFRTEVEPRRFAVITLPDTVAQEIRASGKNVRFVMTVTDVVVDGWAYFKVFPAHVLHTEGVMEGSVFTDVPNSEIDESANTIRIEGPNSKFYVSQFRIIEKE